MFFDSISAEEGEWYVIRVISGTEENVRQSLMQRREAFGLESFLLDVFVPLHDTINISQAGKQTVRKKNIFPGYILVKMIVTNESWYIVRNTPNVTGFLGAGTVPVPVRGEELERLKWVLSEQSASYNIKYQVGDIVTITVAPFDGSEGVITKIDETAGKVTVSVNLLGRETPVELDFASVRSH